MSRSKLRSTAVAALGFLALGLAALGSACGGDGPSRPARSEGISLRTVTGYAAGGRPAALVIADLDGDGLADVAAADAGDLFHERDGGVWTLRNRGGGALEPAVRHEAGRTPMALAAADLDGDGRADLVTANFDSSNVSVLIADGKGGYETQAIDVPIRPSAIAVGDVDGDHRADIAVSHLILNGKRNVTIIRNLGGGAFAAPISFDAGVCFVPAIAIADLDGDGRSEVATCLGEAPALRVLAPAAEPDDAWTEVPLTVSAHAFAVGDLNADGAPDVVLASDYGAGVTIVFGDGAGMFAVPIDLQFTGQTTVLALADLTGDGRPELVTASGDASVSVVLNHGNGFFANPVSYIAGQRITAVAVGDLDGDGIPDVVVADSGMEESGIDGQIGVLLSEAPGRLRASSQQRGSAGMTLGDLTGDGLADLLTVGPEGTLSLLRGVGDGGFGPPAQIPLYFSPENMIVADLDGDGAPDLLTTGGGRGVQVVLNDGHGNLTEIEVKEDISPMSLLLADFDGDQRPDLVALAPDAVTVLHNDGHGSFERPFDLVLKQGYAAVTAAAGDVNGDGAVDLVVAVAEQDDLILWLGDGTGAFAAARTVKTGGTVTSVAMGDVDGDGMNDLVAAIPPNPYRMRGGRIAVLLNDRVAGFSPPVDYTIREDVRTVALGDLDGDGALDVVFGQYEQGRVAVMRNDGTGALEAALTFPAGPFPRALTLGDVDGDGLPEIGVLNQDGAAVLANLSGRPR